MTIEELQTQVAKLTGQLKKKDNELDNTNGKIEKLTTKPAPTLM